MLKRIQKVKEKLKTEALAKAKKVIAAKKRKKRKMSLKNKIQP